MVIFKPDATLGDKIWLAVGLFGQVMFFGRFLVQWIATERARKVVIPLAFWIFSIFGGGILLVYAIHIKDPVFILGQTAGFLIYSRNLYFFFRERRETAAPGAGGGGIEQA
jgi:lipid-A-disaccharide synthase-like uncharacterized protein